MNTSFPQIRMAYGLVVHSQIDLPELMPVLDGQANELAQVLIRIAPVNVEGIPDGTRLDPYLCVTVDELWLHIPGVARFLIRRGCEILVDPDAEADDESIRVFLLGSAFGALLFQRGFLVLHGNAIKIGDHCVICVGDSGIGKSTLAAAFVRRGYPILSDDVVPIDEACCAVPGFPRIKLWQDAADQFGIDTTSLTRIRPDMEKFNFSVLQNYASEKLPVRWVYLLEKHDRPDILVESIRGAARFTLLHENTYRVNFLSGMALKAEHLQLCGKLSRHIRLARVTRPQSGFELDRLVDSILADIAVPHAL